MLASVCACEPRLWATRYPLHGRSRVIWVVACQ